MINGAADYTICYYDKRLKNTHAHQLAASLVFYSPLMTIFWYDRPQFYNGEPEIEWFENLQTVFDESHVLDGMPGKNITMARRKGKEWFVGMLTNNEGSAETLDCAFLDLYRWGGRSEDKDAGEMFVCVGWSWGCDKVYPETQRRSCCETGAGDRKGSKSL